MGAKKNTGKTPEAPAREKQIILDLACRIEERARERFLVKAGNIREQFFRTLATCWPNSAGGTLEKIAETILSGSAPGNTEILAEVRELNRDLLPGERPHAECPIKD